MNAIPKKCFLFIDYVKISHKLQVIVYQRIMKNSAKRNKVWVTVLIAINFMEQDTSNQKDNKHKQRETNRKLFQMRL